MTDRELELHPLNQWGSRMLLSRGVRPNRKAAWLQLAMLDAEAGERKAAAEGKKGRLELRQEELRALRELEEVPAQDSLAWLLWHPEDPPRNLKPVLEVADPEQAGPAARDLVWEALQDHRSVEPVDSPI
jgi:hypothetical protein